MDWVLQVCMWIPWEVKKICPKLPAICAAHPLHGDQPIATKPDWSKFDVCVCLSRCRAWLLLQMSSLRVKHQTAQTPSSKYHGTQILKVVITTRIIIIYNNPFALNQIIFSSWPKVVRIYVFNEPLYSWYSGMVLHFGCPTHQRWWTRIINFHHISLRIWHTKREAFYQDEKDHNFEVVATLLVKW